MTPPGRVAERIRFAAFRQPARGTGSRLTIFGPFTIARMAGPDNDETLAALATGHVPAVDGGRTAW